MAGHGAEAGTRYGSPHFLIRNERNWLYKVPLMSIVFWPAVCE
jgi:hypothetical protein